MLQIPFTKLHGAENDFLLTWRADTSTVNDLAACARRICARNTGIGGDGWMLVERAPNGLKTRLFNSDGSEAEISGNGTRCAAAFALVHEAAKGPDVVIATAAGNKLLKLLERTDRDFLFEMDMGQPRVEELRTPLELSGRRFDATVLNVGNPQCAIFVDEFPSDWRELGREAEGLARFPKGSNVSFVHPAARHALEVLFYERGAGETRSSGTGSTGAAAAAILRDVCASPLDVNTPAGTLKIRWDDSIFLTGPAQVIGEGRFFLEL
jgi:diaminopimelate epimerase